MASLPAGHTMEKPLCPQIPAPLHGHSFLQASHFQLACDRRPEGSTVVSPYRSEYPPRWGTYRREPILPPECAGVLNQDMGDPWETKTDYLTSYPPRPLAGKLDACPPAPCLQMHADPRLIAFTSTTQDNYRFPSEVQRTQPNRVDKWDDSMPGGDKEKIPLPPSLYQQSYPAHDRLSFAAKAPNQHLGSDSTLLGDGNVRFGSSYRSQYAGKWAPPPERYHEGPISVVFGDPRYHEPVSEQHCAYPAPHPAALCHYDAGQAARRVFGTQIQAGDGRQRFSTTMKKEFQQKEAGCPSYPHPHRNASSILRGDESAQQNKGDVTTSYCTEPSIRDLKPCLPSILKDQGTLQLGDQRLRSFSTTQKSDYRQPLKMYKVCPKNSDLLKNNIFFGFPDTGTCSATHDMLVPHPPQKHQLSDELIQKIKYSHLVHPWQGQRWFSTEQQDAYVNKYSGPITLALGDCQRSSVPLGTMKTFQLRPKWPPGI